MYYSDDVIEEVRMKNDIVDVISGYVRLQRKGSSYFGLCPFHNEKSPSFSVSPSKQMYYCFGCGAGGNVFNFIMEYENFTFIEAVKYLADRAGVKLPEQEYSKEARAAADLKTILLEINKKAAAYYYYQLRQETGKKALEYLQKRELSEETIKAFLSCVLRRLRHCVECGYIRCRRNLIVRHYLGNAFDCVDGFVRLRVGKNVARLVDSTEELRPYVRVVTRSVLGDVHRQLEVGRSVVLEVILIDAFCDVVEEVCVVYRRSYRRGARRALSEEQVHDIV